MLRAASEGARTGALPGHADQEARSAGRFDGAGAVPRTRALAGQLRPVLGGAERAGGQAGGDASDDRRAAAGPRVWPGAIAPGGGAGAGTGMFKRGVGPVSPVRHEPGAAGGGRGELAAGGGGGGEFEMLKRGGGPLSQEGKEPGGAAASRGSGYRGTEPV